MSIKLSLSALDRIAQTAAVPTYRRSDLSPGIVHFGVGNFFRAHQAVYLDTLFNLGEGRDWAVIGAGVMSADKEMLATLNAQDLLTTIVAQSAESYTARVAGPMVGFLPPGDTAAVIAQLADPSIRIVSLTVTEGGYYTDSTSAAFDAEHPDMQHDAAHPNNPRSVFGLIAAGLRFRRSAGIAPFTVMSCDNISGNGGVARDAVAGLAQLWDRNLGEWIRSNVAFPNSMVDRITPATSDRQRKIVRDEFRIDDACPVFCEEFSQWVLEDRFPAGRPALEKVGVTFVDDVAPYEHVKIRMLNGGHAIIAYPAALMGFQYVHEAMKNPLIRGYLEKVERDEIIPIMPSVPDTDLFEYYDLIEQRFSNPKVGDTIPRLCQDGSNRQSKFIVPSIVDRVAVGAEARGLTLEVALWQRYFEGTTEDGEKIEFNDPNAQPLHAAALESQSDPMAFLNSADIFVNLLQSESFMTGFANAQASLQSCGLEKTLVRYISGEL